MKHLVATLALLAGAAVAAGVISFWLGSEPQLRQALESRDALAWLRTDFNLDDGQFERIRRLHETYAVECEAHCRAIQEAAMARNALKSTSKADAAALAAADRRVDELRKTCETAIAAHVRQVAACMSPHEGERYLALVLPKIPDFDHRAAPDVGIRSNHGH